MKKAEVVHGKLSYYHSNSRFLKRHYVSALVWWALKMQSNLSNKRVCTNIIWWHLQGIGVKMGKGVGLLSPPAGRPAIHGTPTILKPNSHHPIWQSRCLGEHLSLLWRRMVVLIEVFPKKHRLTERKGGPWSSSCCCQYTKLVVASRVFINVSSCRHKGKRLFEAPKYNISQCSDRIYFWKGVYPKEDIANIPHLTDESMRPVQITSWYPQFNGSHFGLLPCSIKGMTGRGSNFRVNYEVFA